MASSSGHERSVHEFATCFWSGQVRYGVLRFGQVSSGVVRRGQVRFRAVRRG